MNEERVTEVTINEWYQRGRARGRIDRSDDFLAEAVRIMRALLAERDAALANQTVWREVDAEQSMRRDYEVLREILGCETPDCGDLLCGAHALKAEVERLRADQNAVARRELWGVAANLDAAIDLIGGSDDNLFARILQASIAKHLAALQQAQQDESDGN